MKIPRSRLLIHYLEGKSHILLLRMPWGTASHEGRRQKLLMKVDSRSCAWLHRSFPTELSRHVTPFLLKSRVRTRWGCIWEPSQVDLQALLFKRSLPQLSFPSDVVWSGCHAGYSSREPC